MKFPHIAIDTIQIPVYYHMAVQVDHYPNTLDELDFGIVKNDLGLEYATIGSQKVIIPADCLENPFFVGIDGGSVSKMEYREIFSNFKRIFIMCASVNLNDNAYNIFEKVLKRENLSMLGRNFVIFPASTKLLRNNQHKRYANIVSRDVLTEMFPGVNFDTTEIIVPLYDLQETEARMYASLYDYQTSVTDVKTFLDLSDHYARTFKRPIEEQLTNRLTSIRESQYWCDKSNCQITINQMFMDRQFNFRTLLDESIRRKVLGEKTDTETKIIVGKDTDYLNTTYDKKVYVDIYSALKDSNNGKRTYYATMDNGSLKMTKDDIANIMNSVTNERELYSIFNSLLTSKEYCHTVVNNIRVLEKMAPIIEKYKPVYKYLFGYAWLCFYIEECIFKTKSIKGSRYVFDINTANKLPVFPLCNDFAQNPYMTLLADKELINMENNCLSVGYLENHTGYGICTLDQFKWRFNLFTTGDPERNILDGLDWTHFAVSGSVIPACLQRRPVLLDLVSAVPIGEKELDEKSRWMSFFDHYYQNSDIDLMCNDKSIFGFIDKATTVFNTIKTNIPNAIDTDVTLEPIKSMAIVITKHFFNERIQDIRQRLCVDWDVQTMINNLNSYELKEYFYTEYITNKVKLNSQIRQQGGTNLTNDFIRSYLKPSGFDDMNLHLVEYEVIRDEHHSFDSEICFYVNDFRTEETKVPDTENHLIMKIAENIKFKIHSPKMLKSIELFRSKSDDFFGVVGRFHLPCVRAYYQGDNVYMLPSCITALMTGINIEYKYFAGIRDPVDIINKYRMRGFGTLLNRDEKEHMVKYNSCVDKIPKMFALEKTDALSLKAFFGPRNINDRMFKTHDSDSMLRNLDLKYITDLNDLKEYYKRVHKYDPNNSEVNMFNCTTINKNGTINALKPWVADAYYSSVNN